MRNEVVFLATLFSPVRGRAEAIALPAGDIKIYRLTYVFVESDYG